MTKVEIVIREHNNGIPVYRFEDGRKMNRDDFREYRQKHFVVII